MTLAHQFKIRQARQAGKSDADMFGEWYEHINLNLGDSEVRRIDYVTAKTIIEDYEWIGTMPLPKSCRFMYGIYFDGCLGGVAVFVEPSTRQFNNDYPRQVVQLNRGACCYWTPPNTASYFLSRCFKELRKEGIIAVVAYCTKEAGEFGTIYQALGFHFVGCTEPSKVYWLDGYWMSERSLADKRRWAAQTNNDEWIAKFENLESKTLEGKFKYVKPIGTHKQNKRFLSAFGFEPLEYPKRGVRTEQPDQRESAVECRGLAPTFW